MDNLLEEYYILNTIKELLKLKICEFLPFLPFLRRTIVLT